MSIKKCKEIQRKAEKLAMTLLDTWVEVGREDRRFLVESVDPNEVKKVYAYLCYHDDLTKLKQLLEKLPDSALCRTRKTAGYYKNIHSAFTSEGIYKMPLKDAKAVIGWACRLI